MHHEITRFRLKALIQQEPRFRKIIESGDGEYALQQALSEQPAIALIDPGLPRLNGIAVTQRIKSAAPQIKVLIISSHDDDHEIYACFLAGADGYCLKDNSAELLTGAINAVTSGAGWLDPKVTQRVLRQLGRSWLNNDTSKKSTAELETALSERELEVLRLVVAGLSNQQIAYSLVVTIDTIKTHMRHIMEKLAVSDRTQAAVKALRSGIIE